MEDIDDIDERDDIEDWGGIAVLGCGDWMDDCILMLLFTVPIGVEFVVGTARCDQGDELMTSVTSLTALWIVRMALRCSSLTAPRRATSGTDWTKSVQTYSIIVSLGLFI